MLLGPEIELRGIDAEPAKQRPVSERNRAAGNGSLVLLRIRKTLPMRGVVLVVELLVELLVLQMIIKVVKEAQIGRAH